MINVDIKDLPWYKESTGQLIGGFNVIKHRETKEICINSPFGEVYEYSNREGLAPGEEMLYGVVVFNTTRANRFLSEGLKCISGVDGAKDKYQEYLFIVKESQLDLILGKGMLDMKKNLPAMIKRASGIGSLASKK
mgnify:CR=1 FL=1|tara:strand:- start:9027 stop:9434 length:408 start_codon:yes stop_codon:yes gene_type:complete